MLRNSSIKTLLSRLIILMTVLGGSLQAMCAGWPANYQGVMLQGFYWDSYKGSNTTKWTDLTNRADELSQYFSLIWVPNSAHASGENGGGNGYMPIYWFTNHSCAYGTTNQLKTMISTYKEKGVGIIEDVVINHRVGTSNWVNFPAEQWNGQTWQIGLDGICSTDECASNGYNPTGARDTGEDFNGARDLDHTNANVQNNCKNYCKFLLEEMGYAGFRLDMVKGYAGQYTKIYNQYSNPKFCVGEYWDGSYDAVAAWIESTGKTSAAFDFPCKYQINNCFNGGAHKYNELVWKANGTVDQPAGMIHYGYPQYAVTFVDNHDTYRDGSKMTGDVLQANAFILSSPGTPCVFWPHYTQYTSQIQAMIKARNGAGVHNMSQVNVLEVNGNCYVAEVTGTKGKLWVKLGSSSKTPGTGYTKKASGTGYEIWTTAQGGVEPTPDPKAPSSLYVIGEVNGNSWMPNKGVKMTKSGNAFTGDITIGANGGYFSFAVSLTNSDSDWDGLLANGRYAPAVDTKLTTTPQPFELVADGNNAKAYYISDPGTYTITADFSTMSAYIGGSSSVETIETDETEVKWFTMQGVRVEKPERGLYIRVKQGKATKVLVN